jgi:hypothetical protein
LSYASLRRYERMRNRVCNEQLPTREKEILNELGAKVTLRPELETFTTTASLEFLDNVGGAKLCFIFVFLF